MYTDKPEHSLEEDNRILLGRQGKTKIYALCTNQPWNLPFDALVIPVNPHGGFTRFGREFFSAFGDDTYKLLSTQFSQAVQSAMEEQHLKLTEPDKPLLVHLPSEINQKLSSNSEFIADRFIICITVSLQNERSIANCITATKAVVRLAANQGLTRVVTPLIGGGVRNLKGNEVAVAMRQALSIALVNEPKSQVIREITIADMQKDAINTLRVSILETNEFLPQSPQNDLPSGKDLLNIEHEVHALAEVLLMRILEPPLAVGILGGWGSGKSYIMHLMRQKMTQIRSQPLNKEKAWGNLVNCNLDSGQEQLSPYVGHVYQITFDAWTYARSNLWASLMETIFFELNRQLTLEKQLQAAKVSPYEGGKIWEALNEMSDRQRKELFYDANLTEEQFEALQTLGSCREVEDLLWESLKTFAGKGRRSFTI